MSLIEEPEDDFNEGVRCSAKMVMSLSSAQPEVLACGEGELSVQPEIVRCKDCKYYIPYDWMFDGLTRSSNINDYSQDEIGCAVNEHNYPPEGFCSCAERRQDG